MTAILPKPARAFKPPASEKSSVHGGQSVRMLSLTVNDLTKNFVCKHPIISGAFPDQGNGFGRGVTTDSGQVIPPNLASCAGLYVLKVADGLHFEFRMAQPVDPDEFWDEADSEEGGGE